MSCALHMALPDQIDLCLNIYINQHVYAFHLTGTYMCNCKTHAHTHTHTHTHTHAHTHTHMHTHTHAHTHTFSIRLISLAAQKFISEVAVDALQHSKRRGTSQGTRKGGKVSLCRKLYVSLCWCVSTSQGYTF